MQCSRMQNWNAALPQLTLQDVDIDVRRDAHELALSFSAQLPPALGGNRELRGARARQRVRVQTLALGCAGAGARYFLSRAGTSCCRST